MIIARSCKDQGRLRVSWRESLGEMDRESLIRDGTKCARKDFPRERARAQGESWRDWKLAGDENSLGRMDERLKTEGKENLPTKGMTIQGREVEL